MEVVGVYSLEDVEELVMRRGDEEEVEVKVHKCKLREVPMLREMLREQIRERHWGVVGLSDLRQFVAVDEAVGTAAEILIEVASEPSNRVVAAAQARAPGIQAAAGRLREARMRWAQGLGTRLQTVAGVMQRGNRRPNVLKRMLLKARTRCAQVAEREVTTVQHRIGANLIENYRRNL